MEFPTVSAERLIMALEAKEQQVIVDCRCSLLDPAAGRRLYAQGHPPGAMFADLESDLSAPVTQGTGRHPLPTVSQFQRFAQSIGIDNQVKVVVYDDANGAFAARLWWMLTTLGHSQVQVLEGGIQAYGAAGGVLETGEVVPATVGDFSAVGDWAILSADEVMARSDITLIDARAAERYRGENETIDTKAGHVPGALNLPFTSNLNGDGTFKTAAEIKENFAALDLQGQAVVMCGSGVTACHLLLARAIAQLPALPLYAGSWSEWITDPTRPIATG